jgi:anthranilate phosphoribosyltransferase
MTEELSDFRDTVRKLAAGKDLTSVEAAAATEAIIDGRVTPTQVGAFLLGLRQKGEAVSEIAGVATKTQERLKMVDLRRENLVDIAGTGTEKVQTFNISTAAAIVAAGAGVRIAKQVVRSASGRIGAADTLTALGVNVEVGLLTLQRCIHDVGLAFLPVTAYHTVTSLVEPARHELGIRTIFSIAGPITNPAGAKRLVIGVPEEKQVETLAQIMKRLGCQYGMVVSGLDGLDEISIGGKTKVCEIVGGTIQNYYLSPDQVGIARTPAGALRATTAEESALIVNEVLNGAAGPARDIVTVNAAAIIRVGGFASSLEKGVEVARRTLDAGRAREVLERLIKLTQV